MPQRPKQEEGMEKPKRARRRKLETAKVDLKPPPGSFGGQGAHREVGSEGLAEKHRVAINGSHPEDGVPGVNVKKTSLSGNHLPRKGFSPLCGDL